MFRRLGLVGVLVFNLVMVTFVAAPLVGAATATVSPDNLNGWATISRRTASGSFVNGLSAPGAGVGSYRMATGAGGSGPDLPGDPNNMRLGGKTWLSTQLLDLTRLDAISALSYSTYITTRASNTSVAPSINLYLDLNGDNQRDTTLVYEPVYSVPEQAATTTGTWQTWQATAGRWWFTNDQGTKNGHTYCASGCFNFFSDIVADFPGAKIVTWYSQRSDGYGFNFVAGQSDAGGPWNDFNGNIDNFSITVSGVNSTFDFEPLMTCYVNASSPPGNDGNGGTSATDAKKTIQACINITGSGGTVIVAAGTYAENLNVDRPLTIKGPNFGVNANTGSRPTEAVITPASTTNTL